jgi:hypothetical protein
MNNKRKRKKRLGAVRKASKFWIDCPRRCYCNQDLGTKCGKCFCESAFEDITSFPILTEISGFRV